MKVCILANSHAKMLKLATDAAPPKGWTPTYFAAPAAGMGQLAVAGKSLKPLTASLKSKLIYSSGGQKRIRFDDYDAFVVAGLGLRMPLAYNLFNKHQPFGVRIDDERTLVSEAAFRASLRQMYSQSIAYRFASALRRTRKPVIIVPAPIPNERLLLEDEYKWIDSPRGAAAIQWLNALCMEEWRGLMGGRRTVFVEQPAETLGPLGLTWETYAERARFNNGRKEDSIHANLAYGLLVLGRLNAELASLAPRAVPQA